MDTQEIRTLKLLEELEGEKTPSQRDLAIRLNISLGLVNSFMKRLAQKGYFKVTNIPKNRVRYILTPKGTAEKTRLTYEYIQMSFRYYKNARLKLRTLFRQFEEQKIDRIAFFGAGELTEIAYISLQETNIKLVAIADSDKIGDNLLGLRILAPEELRSLNFQKVVVTETNATGNAMNQLIEQGIRRSQVEFVYIYRNMVL